jgi:hypothetical protein
MVGLLFVCLRLTIADIRYVYVIRLFSLLRLVSGNFTFDKKPHRHETPTRTHLACHLACDGLYSEPSC